MGGARNRTIAETPFPFPRYRKGSGELAVRVCKTIAGGGKLFVQAPTGTGKTISVLFPAVKAMGEGKTRKFFCLTAKTITRWRRRRHSTTCAAAASGSNRHLTAKGQNLFCDTRVCRPGPANTHRVFRQGKRAVYDVVIKPRRHHPRRHRGNTPNATRSALRIVAGRIAVGRLRHLRLQLCFRPAGLPPPFFAEGQRLRFPRGRGPQPCGPLRGDVLRRALKSQFTKSKTIEKNSRDLDRLLNAVNKHMIGLRKKSAANEALSSRPRSRGFLRPRLRIHRPLRTPPEGGRA